MTKISCFITIALLLTTYSCIEEVKVKNSIFGTSDLVAANTHLLSIAMEDGFPPPIASRVYVYPHIAHYLSLMSFYPDSLVDISTKLKGFKRFNSDTTDVNAELASLLSFCFVAKKLVFSEHLVDELKTEILSKAKSGGISENRMNRSIAFAEKFSTNFIKWLVQDNYTETRAMDRWTSSKKPGLWRETPPDYQQGLEPHWGKMRLLVLDSVGIYQPKALPVYSPNKSSDFYKMVEKVYKESKVLDSTKVTTALYWDDNPNISEHRGHLVTTIHKISPPGHWLSIISGIVSKEKYSILKSTEAYTFSAIAMYDGLISSWDVKYKTNLVRPISYIQEYIDVDWQPLIQTPPFPEYTSGHSVTSACAATVLGHLIGKHYGFTDSTQVLFGMQPRYFNNFDEAAWEVSLSRFYGGIHYMNGVEEGNKQGKMIGNYIFTILKS